MNVLKKPWLIFPVTALLVSCGDDPVQPPPLPPPAPIFNGATATANPNNVISAVVEVQAARYDSVWIDYWATGGAVRTTPITEFEDDSVVTLPVLGLDAGRSDYNFAIKLAVGDSVVVPDTLAFVTDTLPSWIPAATVSGTDTTPGLLALSYPRGPVIIDNTGKVFWYLEFEDAILNSFQIHANGLYSILGVRDSTKQFHLLDPLGDEVATLQCVGFETRFHDFRIMKDGDYWIMCNDDRTMDLSSLGGDTAAAVEATVVQHVGADGTVLFEWNSFDHFQITDLDANARGGPNVNFTHGNALEFDTDGNLLVSFRSLSEVTKIDITTGDVIWRFGGLANQFTFVNDAKGSFFHQHGVRVAQPGQIQLLDNSAGPPSRFVRYAIDEQNMTATLVTEFTDGNAWTSVGGATEYYPNGNAIVTFGRAGRVVELDPAGNIAWRLNGIDGVYVFRTQRLMSLYRPEPLGM